MEENSICAESSNDSKEKDKNQEDKSAAKISDHAFRNVILLGLAFMLIFTALSTTAMIQQTMLKSMQEEDSSFTGDGYISMALIYSFFSISNFFAPSLVSLFGPKRTLIFCSLFYILFIVNFIFTTTWSLYLTSVLIGIAAAGLWTSQGTYISLNSNEQTISRNTGITWIFLSNCQFIGNGFVFWQFLGKTHIDSQTRIYVMSFLTGVVSLGTCCLMFLENIRPFAKESNEKELKTDSGGPISAFKNALNLLKNRKMHCLIPSFILVGANITFFAGIYPTSVGFTAQFGSIAKGLVGLSGIFVGIGSLISGTFVTTLGAKLSLLVGRTPLFLLGCIFLTTGYTMAAINIPNNAPLGSTDDYSLINPPSPVLAMLVPFAIGMGDALVHTQIYGSISSIWEGDSSGAFANLNFFKSTTMALQFCFSTQSGLLGHLGFLQVICIIAGVFFAILNQHKLTSQAQVALNNASDSSTVAADECKGVCETSMDHDMDIQDMKS